MTRSEVMDFVQKYWDGEGDICGECTYFRQYQESRGEHFGTPCSETINECTILDQNGDPFQCLAWQTENA